MTYIFKFSFWSFVPILIILGFKLLVSPPVSLEEQFSLFHLIFFFLNLTTWSMLLTSFVVFLIFESERELAYEVWRTELSKFKVFKSKKKD
jgi:hypothetical protein